MNIREFTQNLQTLYAEMSQEFSAYQEQSGLHCLSGCGQCCLNPEVEASVLEMLPLALRLHRENKLEEWIERLENVEGKPCLLYEAHSPDGKQGRCGAYEGRPSLCRMFGVSGYYNKHRKVTLSICRYIRAENPELSQQKEAEATAENTPMLVQWSYRLTQLDPALIQDRMPINQALKKALEKVALYALYQED
jgi:Fe-S-cluster containining protein